MRLLHNIHGILCGISGMNDNRETHLFCQCKLTAEHFPLCLLHCWLLIPIIIKPDFSDGNGFLPGSLSLYPC